MAQRWLDILRQSDDQNLGASLIGLAHLARAAHQFQAVATDGASSDQFAQQRVEGIDPQAERLQRVVRLDMGPMESNP